MSDNQNKIRIEFENTKSEKIYETITSYIVDNYVYFYIFTPDRFEVGKRYKIRFDNFGKHSTCIAVRTAENEYENSQYFTIYGYLDSSRTKFEYLINNYIIPGGLYEIEIVNQNSAVIVGYANVAHDTLLYRGFSTEVNIASYDINNYDTFEIVIGEFDYPPECPVTSITLTMDQMDILKQGVNEDITSIVRIQFLFKSYGVISFGTGTLEINYLDTNNCLLFKFNNQNDHINNTVRFDSLSTPTFGETPIIKFTNPSSLNIVEIIGKKRGRK